MLMPDDRFVFGRVVRVNVRVGSFEDGILVYLYQHRAGSKDLPERKELGTNELLIPPVIVNRIGWTRGYFETVGNIPFEEGEVLKQHHFFDPVHGRFVDLDGSPVPGELDPVGIFALGNFRTVDDDVSEALGIPHSAD